MAQLGDLDRQLEFETDRTLADDDDDDQTNEADKKGDDDKFVNEVLVECDLGEPDVNKPTRATYRWQHASRHTQK